MPDVKPFSKIFLNSGHIFIYIKYKWALGTNKYGVDAIDCEGVELLRCQGVGSRSLRKMKTSINDKQL